MPLPENFVWTRYGVESGEDAHSIFARKERERLAAGGVFLWGVGNSTGPSVRKLLAQQTTPPAVVFSPMLCAPRSIDAAPAAVVAWRRAQGLDGQAWALPESALVTSHAGTPCKAKKRHYALVCYRDAPVEPVRDGCRFSLADVCNYASGRRVGPSQVSCVVRRIGATHNGVYLAAMVATLTYPYVVELHEAVALHASA